jgi:hypothetical protein
MEQFEESWDDVASDAARDRALAAELEAEFALDSDPEELWRSLIADEEHPRYWSESVWSHDAPERPEIGALLFAERGSEDELCHEIRLSELWGYCESGCLAMDEFFELSALITEVLGLPGCLCADCDMLGRPNVSPNWALATTDLCRAHLRFRLGHVRIDGGTSRR